MADPCYDRIVAAFVARLETIAASDLPGLKVEEGREDDIGDDELPFVAVYAEDETPQDDLTGERGYTVRISVEGLAKGADRTAARKEASRLRGLVDKALFSDVTLGGLARDLRLGQEPPPPALATVAEHVAGFVRVYEIDYATAESDPFTFAS